MKMKCDKCINKPWKECCNNCKELEYSCYVCKNMVKVKDYIEHLGYHYSDPDQYLTCSMCNVYKNISLYRFRNRKCRLCIYLHCVSTDLSVFDCAIIVRFLSYLATANSIRSQQAWFNIALHCLEDRMKSACHAKMAAAIDKESHHH